MGYGDNAVWAPSKRWALLVAYWAVSFTLAYQRGIVAYLLEQDVKTPNHLVYPVHFILHIPLFLASWDYNVFGFNRPVSYFSAVVYPLMHCCDTLIWFYTFDLGRSIVKGVLMYFLGWDDVHMIIQFIGGWVAFAIFIIIHRATFELHYLPEHREFLL